MNMTPPVLNEISATKKMIQNIVDSSRLNKFVVSRGMMEEFTVNGIGIKKVGDSFEINGKMVDNFAPDRLRQIQNLLGQN